MATSQSKIPYKKVPSTDLGVNVHAQAFENLAKKLHRLESKAGTYLLCPYVSLVPRPLPCCTLNNGRA